VYNNALQGFSNSQQSKGWQNEGIGSSGVERMYNAYTDISSGWQNGITQWVKDTAAFVSNPISNTVQAINASVFSGKEFTNSFVNSGESDLGNYIMKGAYNTASKMSLYDWSYAAGYMAPDLALGMGGGYVMSTVRMPFTVANKLGSLKLPVYRVYGGGSSMYGKSYSIINPKYVPFYRNFAGLPNANSGQYLLRGYIPF